MSKRMLRETGGGINEIVTMMDRDETLHQFCSKAPARLINHAASFKILLSLGNSFLL